MRFAIVLALVLGVTWLSLSGYFTTMLLTLGTISVLFVIWMCMRMAILDKETVPYLSLPCLLYTSPSPRDATLSRMPSSA